MTTMSVTDREDFPGREPNPDTNHGTDNGLWIRTISALKHAAAGLFLLVLINVLAGPTGYWSADEAVSHQQVELLAQGRWTIPPPEPEIDPTGRWHTLNAVSLGEGVVAPYVKHPLFPVLVRGGDLLGGRIGRFLIPALGSIIAALLIAEGANRRRAGSAAMSFWVVLVGTPLLFHGATLWAHSISIASAAAACLLIQPFLDRQNPSRHGAEGNDSAEPSADAPFGPALLASFAAAVAVGVLLRSEAAIYFILFGCCLGAFGLVLRRRPLIALGVVSIFITLATYKIDGILRSAILGPGGDVSLNVPPEPIFDLGVRGALTWTWLVGSKPTLGLARIIGAILLTAAATSARPGSTRSLSPWLGLIGGLMYVPALNAEATLAVAPAAPAVLVGLILVAKGDHFTRLAALLSILFFAAVVATSYANGGGGDWGGRYLAMLLAPLAIIGLPELWRLKRSTEYRPLFIGVIVASVALGASMSLNVVHQRRTTSELAQEIADDIAQYTDGNDLLVSTDGRIGRLLGDTEAVDARLLQVPGDEMEELARLVPTGTGLVIVSIDHVNPFEIPENWTVLEESEHLVRVLPKG